MLGVILFIVGNFLGGYLPETWLKPMAWCSSIALCISLLFGEVMTLMCGGICFYLIGGLLSLIGWINYDFVDKAIFCHPTGGAIAVALFLISIKYVMGKERNFLACLGAFLLGALVGRYLWIFPASAFDLIIVLLPKVVIAFIIVGILWAIGYALWEKEDNFQHSEDNDISEDEL